MDDDGGVNLLNEGEEKTDKPVSIPKEKEKVRGSNMPEKKSILRAPSNPDSWLAKHSALKRVKIKSPKDSGREAMDSGHMSDSAVMEANRSLSLRKGGSLDLSAFLKEPNDSFADDDVIYYSEKLGLSDTSQISSFSGSDIEPVGDEHYEEGFDDYSDSGVNHLETDAPVEETAQEVANDGGNTEHADSEYDHEDRSKVSCSNGVKWKAVIDEELEEPNAQDCRDSEKDEGPISMLRTQIEKITTALKDNEKMVDSEVLGMLDSMKLLAIDASKEFSIKRRKMKNEQLKLRAQIERLNEKVKVNILLDSRIKEQNATMLEIKEENESLRAVLDQKKFSESASDEVYDSMRQEIEELKSINQELVSKSEKKDHKKDIITESKTMKNSLNGSSSSYRVKKEADVNSDVLTFLKETNRALLKTNTQLAKTNNSLLATNDTLNRQVAEMQKSFEEEKTQWSKNWELLKQHYRLRYK